MNPTSLQTSQAKAPEGSVFYELRSLMPKRPLSFVEALERAELQANRMLSLFGIDTPAVPMEIISGLPRIRLRFEYDLPVSGSAHWDGLAWVLTLNASEQGVRQRFSLLHEFKHVLDHPGRERIEAEGTMSASDKAERIADYFEQLARDVTGWPARLTEYFQLLAATQHLNHVRLHVTAPDLRRVHALEREVFRLEPREGGGPYVVIGHRRPRAFLARGLSRGAAWPRRSTCRCRGRRCRGRGSSRRRRARRG